MTLHGAAARLAAARGLSEWAISLSHTGTHAVGMAVALALDAALISTNAPIEEMFEQGDDQGDAAKELKR